MGTVFKKQTTRSLPVGAELFTKGGQRYARWKPAKGKTRTARVTTGRDGSERIVTESPTFLAKYRDGSGYVCEVSTGCRDEAAARSVLGELEKRAEKVRSGILSATEETMAGHQHSLLTDHLSGYVASLKAAGRAKDHVKKTERLVKRLIDELSFRRLTDIRPESVERWLAQQTTVGMAARTRNSYLVALRSFLNWCVKRDRLPINPLTKLDRADEKADRRRERRAFTAAELAKLLIVARLRPLAEYGRETTKTPNQDTTTRQKRSRATWTLKPLTFDELPAAVELARERLKDNPAFLARQERLGIERALAYTIAVTTGLRLGELGSLTVGQVELDEPCPHVRLKAADEKNRQGNTIPLRRDVADELRQWVSGLGGNSRSQTDVLSFNGRGESTKLSPTTKLFSLSAELSKVLNRDRGIAGIDKRDDRGRVVDFHALRHTFGTNLSKAGVSPRVAQAAMRHSTIDLTMNVYTDPRLLDVQGAVESLPSMSITSDPNENRQSMAAGAENLVAPLVAPTHDVSSVSRTTAVTLAAFQADGDFVSTFDVIADADNAKRSLSSTDNEREQWDRWDSNPEPKDYESPGNSHFPRR